MHVASIAQDPVSISNRMYVDGLYQIPWNKCQWIKDVLDKH